MNFTKYLCFPETYDEGRDWFRLAVTETHGELITATNPHAPGPSGGTLSTDTAWFGPKNASRVFVSISGTHGHEYYFGAAAQLNWIATGGSKNLPNDVAVCLIHANNPYGAAYASRGNENFIDLNRNYFDHAKEVRPNALYSELYELLFTKEMNEHVLDDVMTSFYDFVENNDTQQALTAMGGGQNTHPKGTLYCGTQEEWSTGNLRTIVGDLLSQAEKLAIIDWHTGVGEFAAFTALHELPMDTDEYRWACAWWDAAHDRNAIYEDEKPDFIGHVCHGIADDLRARGAKVAETVFEAGTMDNRSVLAALLIDRWLRFECSEPNSPHSVKLRTQMLERLNPSLHGWRQTVLEKAATIYDRSIRGLGAWRH